jgi:hypothetical protein
MTSLEMTVGTSDQALLPTPPDTPRSVNCTICGDRKLEESTVEAPCPSHHHYCTECIRLLFLHATRDETLMPPSCDRVPIPIELVAQHLTHAELDHFERKAYEFGTNDRLYCAQARCSEFLGPASDGMRECFTCDSLTCGTCKSEWHGDDFGNGVCDGPKDASDEVVAQALLPALSRMSSSSRIDRGLLPHVSRVGIDERGWADFPFAIYRLCLCSKEFCYICAAPWKNCRCPQWDERLLYRAAERRVHRQEPIGEGQVNPPIVRARRIVEVMDELRDDHDCAHKRWSMSHGGRCESCSTRHRKFLMVSPVSTRMPQDLPDTSGRTQECKRCAIRVCAECVRCRHFV